MKDFFKFKSMKEEHGAGDTGTPLLVAKYKTGTPGQTSAAPTRQPARKGDKLNAKMDYSSTITQKDIGVKNTMKEDAIQESDAAYAKSKETEKRNALTNKDRGTLDKLKAMMSKEKKPVVKENNEIEKSEMAETQLYFISYAAEEIIEYIGMGGEIDEWYQNKLSKAHSDMEGLHSHIEGEKRRTGMTESHLEEADQIDELKTSTLTRYGTKAVQSLGQNPEKTDKRVKGIRTARYKVQQK